LASTAAVSAVERYTFDVASLLSTGAYKEVYPLIEPYAYAVIIEEPATRRIRYLVVEPELDDQEEEAKKRIFEWLLENLDKDPREFDSKEMAETYVREWIKKAVRKLRIRLSETSLDKISYYLIRDIVYLGKLEPLMRDPRIEDISCNGVGIPFFVWHSKYESIPTNIVINDEEELDRFLFRLAFLCDKHLSIARPLVDAALPDGSRIQMTYGRDVSKRGSSFTIRKFRAEPFSIVTLLNFGTLDPFMSAFFWFCIEHRKSIMIAGATASGKTTSVNALASFFKPELKIVTIEDTPELNFMHENWVQSVARTGYGASERGEKAIGEISLFDLLKAALRQRPDFIIVGEIRGAEAYALFQALATGHGGITTIHADTIEGVIHRLTTPPMNIPKTLLPMMNIVVIQARTRFRGKSVRRMMLTTEMVGIDPDSGELLTNDIFRWNARNDTFWWAGRSYLIERIRREFGYSRDYVEQEIKRRETVLRWMQKARIDNYREVTIIIRQYYANPEKIHERAVAGLAA